LRRYQPFFQRLFFPVSFLLKITLLLSSIVLDREILLFQFTPNLLTPPSGWWWPYKGSMSAHARVRSALIFFSFFFFFYAFFLAFSPHPSLEDVLLHWLITFEVTLFLVSFPPDPHFVHPVSEMCFVYRMHSFFPSRLVSS